MFLWDKIAFGPIHSRRLGNSLGINLLPTDVKICTFNCLYCECGWTLEKSLDEKYFYPLQTVLDAIEQKIKTCSQEGTPVDSITFSGNGEPTLHPDFPAIIDRLLQLRDIYYPKAVITCLSNSTKLGNPKVREALKKIENPILKLDAVDEELFQIVSGPTIELHASEIIRWMSEMKQQFILQTLFFRGETEKGAFDNGTGNALQKWLQFVEQVQPKMVMIYSLDRETPAQKLFKYSKEELEAIAEKVKSLNINVNVY